MRTRRNLFCFLVVILLSVSFLFQPVGSDGGPRTEDLIIRYYADIEAAYQALKLNEIDIVGYGLTKDLYYDAVADSNLCLGPVGDRGMYEFDINCNHTIPDLPGIESPTYGIKRKDFRKAITLLVNKNKIVKTHCAGFADRIDQPIAYMQRGWRNTSFWYEDNIGYEYDPALAATVFDDAGFTQGSTPNPYYDLDFPGSAQYIRVYPQDHPTHAGQDLHDLKVAIRTDDRRRMEAGRDLCDALRMSGIPVNQAEGWPWWPWWLDDRNYHIYTGGWSLGRFPPLTLYQLYSGQFWYESGPNYVTGCKAPYDTIPTEHLPPDPMWTPVPGSDCDVDQRNFPKLDYYLYKARFPANHSKALEYSRKALGYGWSELFITIPIFSARSFWAWSTDVKGVVNREGTGPENSCNFMNAYKTEDGPITYGIKTPPNEMNIVYSSWYYDYQNLERMNLAGGMDTPPYDQSVDQVGFLSDWKVGTWVDPDDAEEKSLITQCYRTDAYFRKPVSGDLGEQVNNTHIYASIWYYYQQPDPWIYPGVMDIKTLRMIDCSHIKPGQTGIEIYCNTTDYWNVYQVSTYILSFDWFSLGNLSTTVSETLTSDADGYLSTTGPVFWVKSARQGGTPLTVGVDYDIYMSKAGHTSDADVRIINPAYVELPIDITYLAAGDATGYTPGNVAWQQSFEGAGMFYAVNFLPGTGGYLILERNPTYPMETPPLGEIDFMKKPDGSHNVDIFDVVLAASAYGTQGVAVPDDNWFPGADLADPGGYVDIFDIVTITGKYGMTWDSDP